MLLHSKRVRLSVKLFFIIKVKISLKHWPWIKRAAPASDIYWFYECLRNGGTYGRGRPVRQTDTPMYTIVQRCDAARQLNIWHFFLQLPHPCVTLTV